jgi:hypothetical protein
MNIGPERTHVNKAHTLREPPNALRQFLMGTTEVTEPRLPQGADQIDNGLGAIHDRAQKKLIVNIALPQVEPGKDREIAMTIRPPRHQPRSIAAALQLLQ